MNCSGEPISILLQRLFTVYPEAYNEYKKLCLINNFDDLLGKADMIFCHDGRVVCNLFSLINKETDIVHFEKAFMHMCNDVALKKRYYKKSIAVPYKIGCATDEHQWSFIKRIINDNDLRYGVYGLKINIYKLKENK